jgi:enediyne biosynthesis protein E4
MIGFGETLQTWMLNRRSFLLAPFTLVPLERMIDFKHEASRTSEKYLMESMGAGVAIFAYNGVRGHHYGMGVATGDYDNDGFSDLFVTNLGTNILYHNNGDGTFTDVTEQSGLVGSGWCAGACCVDYDRHGRLDLIVTRYLEWDFASNIYCGQHRPGYRAYCSPDQFKPAPHLVYHNNGDGTAP